PTPRCPAVPPVSLRDALPIFRPEHERIRIGGRGGLLIGFRARACCEQRAKHGGAEAASERSSGIHRETTIAGNLPTLVIPLTFPDNPPVRVSTSHAIRRHWNQSPHRARRDPRESRIRGTRPLRSAARDD